MSMIKLNLKKIILALTNTLISIIVFFAVRRVLLRIFIGAKVGNFVTIHRSVKFFDFKKLTIGDYSTVNYGCYLDNRAEIEIGCNVNISHNVRIYTLGHDINSPTAATVGRKVKICDNVWIFPNVLIMPGVTVGEGAVIYPGSVVTKDIPPFNIMAGNPASFIKLRSRDISYKAFFPVWFAI